MAVNERLTDAPTPESPPAKKAKKTTRKGKGKWIMNDPMEEARKKIKGLPADEQNDMPHCVLGQLEEDANIYERLAAARAFVAAMDKEA
jgi:hypothetical protein